MTPALIVKVIGLILATVVFWNSLGIPWGLLAGAALAMIALS